MDAGELYALEHLDSLKGTAQLVGADPFVHHFPGKLSLFHNQFIDLI